MLFCGFTPPVWRSPMSAVRDGRTHTHTHIRTIDEKFMNEPLVVVCLSLFALLPCTATGCDAVVNLSLVNTARRRLIKQRWTCPCLAHGTQCIGRVNSDWLIDCLNAACAWPIAGTCRAGDFVYVWLAVCLTNRTRSKTLKKSYDISDLYPHAHVNT